MLCFHLLPRLLIVTQSMLVVFSLQNWKKKKEQGNTYNYLYRKERNSSWLMVHTNAHQRQTKPTNVSPRYSLLDYRIDTLPYARQTLPEFLLNESTRLRDVGSGVHRECGPCLQEANTLGMNTSSDDLQYHPGMVHCWKSQKDLVKIMSPTKT